MTLCDFCDNEAEHEDLVASDGSPLGVIVAFCEKHWADHLEAIDG